MVVDVITYKLVGGPWDGLQVGFSHNVHEIQVPKAEHTTDELESNKMRYGKEYPSDTEFYRYAWNGDAISGTRMMSYTGVITGYGK